MAANWTSLVFVFAIITRKVLEAYGYIAPDLLDDTLSKDEIFLFSLNMIVNMLTLVIACIPEALNLAIINCIDEFLNLQVLQSGQIVFRQLSALEKIGRIDFMVLEKQGTLTDRDKMEVQDWWVCSREFKGCGSDLRDRFSSSSDSNSQDQKEVEFDERLVESIYYGSTAWAEVSDRSSCGFIYKGNNTEQALLKYLIHNHQESYSWLINKEALPIEVLHWKAFNAERKRTTIVMRHKGSKTVRILCKGQDNSILSICSHIATGIDESEEINEDAKNEVESKRFQLNTQKQKCLAFSYKTMDWKEYIEIKNKFVFKRAAEIQRQKTSSCGDNCTMNFTLLDDEKLIQEIEAGSTLIGLCGISDPIKTNVTSTLECIANAGIRTIICTGDSMALTQCFAEDVEFAQNKTFRSNTKMAFNRVESIV